MKNFLPLKRKRHHSLRSIVDAIFWYLRIGAQWRNLPDNFPDWHSVYYYFRKWKADDTLEKVNFALNGLERERIGKQSTPALF